MQAFPLIDRYDRAALRTVERRARPRDEAAGMGAMTSRAKRWSALAAIVLIGAARRSEAQTDEIQVYDAEIVAPGTFGLTWHNNFTISGRMEPAFPGGIAPHHALNGVPELAYGVADWLEVGLYAPLYTVTGEGEFLIDGTKLRALFVVPHAETRSFFYGVNFELSYNSERWEETRLSGEIRFIVGARAGPVDLIFNPILDTSFEGIGQLDFAPAARVAYNFPPTWALAIEDYADFGRVDHLEDFHGSEHTLFVVVDCKGDKLGTELGVGHGLTSNTDACVVKLMLEIEF
jgi:hypothetical protein